MKWAIIWKKYIIWNESVLQHDDVIKWKHFPRYWPFVRGIHWWRVDPPHKGQWRGALMFSLICVWTNGWANNRDAGDLRHHRAHYDATVINCIYIMFFSCLHWLWSIGLKRLHILVELFPNSQTPIPAKNRSSGSKLSRPQSCKHSNGIYAGQYQKKKKR